jgi:8-oxo-dGTP pyrophosphatase MutT (NUDIX family)
VAREIREETGWTVRIGPILDSWMYHIGVAQRHDYIVTYGCRLDTDAEPVLSGEHRELGMFGLDETARLPMPAGYRRSIASWFVRLGT